ncbi:MAG: thiamine-monophosphate kinase [Leptospiraceae bacterium]|nr:MAG: thiamine-monophosphate kinase [Leptospiraceae bacterium]
MKKLKEEDIIKLFTQKNKNFHFDDCEILPVKKSHYKNIITCDTMIEETHFKIEWHNPIQLAKKLFHINLSDLISSGGIPLWCTLQMGFSYKKVSSDYIKTFIKQFLKECNKYQCPLIGGDTFYSQLMVLSLTMGGYTKNYLTRNSYPDSYIYVTGNFGLSLLGYKLLAKKTSIPEKLKNIALKKHLSPSARLEWAKKIYPYAISMMDVSDGLYQDLQKMAKISNYQFEIHLEKIPIHPAFKNIISPEEALISGEEYELIFTSKKELNLPFVTKIGKVSSKKLNSNILPLIIYFNNKKYSIKEIGYEHF